MDADILFGGPTLEAKATTMRGELRWYVTGMIADPAVTAIITRSGDAIRLISLR